MDAGSLHRLRTAARWGALLLALSFIGLFFAHNREPLQLLRQVGWIELAALALLYPVYFLAQASRFKVILDYFSGSSIALLPWFKLFVLARFLNTFIPQSGNVYRGLRLKQDHGIGYTTYVSSYLSFAWIDSSLNLLCGSAVAAIWAPRLALGGWRASSLLLVLAAAAVVAPLLLAAALRYATSRARLRSKLLSSLSRACDLTLDSVRDPVYVLRLAVLGAGAVALACLMFLIGFRALGVPIGVGEAVIFYVLLRLTAYVSITPSNLGVLEIGFGLLGATLAIGMGEGMLVAMLLRLVSSLMLIAIATALGGLRLARRIRGSSQEPAAGAESSGGTPP